jgi:NDP-sugar pyrophosphorylase family protein
MIFAAGMGTRLRPLTDNTPKALLDINGYTLLQRAILKLRKHGIQDIIINIHHYGSQIRTYLDKNKNFGANIAISDESERILDTGGGLKKAAPFFSGTTPFVLYNCDILSSIDLNMMGEYHLTSGSLGTLAVRNRDSSRQLLFDMKDVLCGWRNNNSGEEKIVRSGADLHPAAFSGIHILSPEVLTLFPAEDVFSIIDFYLSIAGRYELRAFDHSSTTWADAGKLETVERLRNNSIEMYL